MPGSTKAVRRVHQHVVDRAKAIADRHPDLKAFVQKLAKDNVGFLASGLAWSILTSIIAVMVAVVAISALLLQSPGNREAVVAHLSTSLAGVLSRKDIAAAVNAAQQHSGLLGIVGFLGVLWGGSNIGGSISTVFQPVFQVRGRPFLQEKLIDVGMILVFTVLLIVIALSSTAIALLNKVVTNAPFPGIAQLLLGVGIGLIAAFALFFAIYSVFPNTDPRFKLPHVWKGAAIAAVLFEALSLMFPLYVAIARFSRYGALLAAILILTAWIYFLAVILLVGAEFVAFGAIKAARHTGVPAGPIPDGTVPQRMDSSDETARPATGHRDQQ
jgi:membrane protein